VMARDDSTVSSDYVALAPGERTIELLALEASSRIQMLPLITTATFYKGAPPIAFLEERVKDIVKANPWLCGKVAKRSGKHVIVCDTAPVPSLFVALRPHEVPIHNGMSLREVGSLIQKKLEPPKAPDAIQFKVALVPDDRTPDDAFCLVVSLSHTLGDGATYYALLNMLDAAAGGAKPPVRPLQPIRHKITPHEEVALMGKAEVGFTTTPGYVCGFLSSVCRGCCVAKAVPQAWSVNERWLAQQKERGASESDVGFVSSNDVLTSWFFRSVRATVGLMAVNLRGRAGMSASADDAGNYESLLLYRPADYAGPAMLRRSIATMRRGADPPTKLPGCCSLCCAHMAIVSNWATFHNGLDLPGCEQIVHYPMMASAPVNLDLSSAVIFRPREGELAIWSLSPRMKSNNQVMERDGPLGEPMGAPG
jgi:hypothetical protein